MNICINRCNKIKYTKLAYSNASSFLIPGKVDAASKTLHGVVVLNPSAYSSISQQIFRILTTNSSTYQYISVKSLTVHANTAFGSLMPSPVPEISFVHSRTNAKCKIRFENYLSVQKTRLFNFYSRLDVRFWPLLMLVRHWGTQFRALRSADTLDFQNYAVCLLLVHFLVSKKIIPSLHELQSMKDSGVDKSLLVNNYDISFCTNASLARPNGSSSNPALQDKDLRTLSILSILKAFFVFYSSFDFRAEVICPYVGMTFQRELFHAKNDSKQLPEQLSAYLNGPDGKGRPEKLYLHGPICVQDLFELTTNVTRNITVEEVTNFVNKCARTVEILDNVLNQSGDVILADVFSEND